MSSNPDSLDQAKQLELISAFEFTQLIYVVAKLRIADLLKDGKKASADELASKCGAHPRTLYRVMRYLASLGIFSQDGDSIEKFGSTTTSDLLRSDIPDSYWPWAILNGEEFYHAAGDMLHAVLTGETPFDHVYQTSFFDYLSSHPNTSEIFNRAMNTYATNWDSLPSSFDFSKFKKIADVGGGQGALLVTVLRANPSMRGILLDLPHVVRTAVPYLESHGVLDRCDIVLGDALQSVPEGADLYVLASVLHIFQDDKAKLILNNCRRAIRGQDAKLMIIEGVVPEGSSPSPSKNRDITMLYLVGGAERREFPTLPFSPNVC